MAVSEEHRRSSTLVFYVNGKKITDDKVDPETTLLQYLRLKLHLTGTKVACGQGGCGACTVMVSRYDRTKDLIKHITVMACLFPMGNVHGAAVTTVEGIGSVEKGLHPVQERIVKAHGTQCGFCTPGMVMSMYCLLRNNPIPTKEQVEKALEGNLCRCTGYRPILDGFNTFTKECSMGDNCCQRGGAQTVQEEGIATELFKASEFTPYDPSQDPIFPPALQLSGEFDGESLRLVGESVTWHRPVKLDELFTLKSKYPDAFLVRGNTDLGILGRKTTFPVLISVTHVLELSRMDAVEDGIHVGAGTTLSELEETLETVQKTLPEYKARGIKTISEIVSRLGNRQIRNVASVAGNLLVNDSVADLNTVLSATRAILTFINADGKQKKLQMGRDHSHHTLAADGNYILSNIYIPYTAKHEYFQAYKQSLRRADDKAIVVAAMRVVLEEDSDAITDISICFGGLPSTTVICKVAQKSAIARVWEESLVTDMCQWLREDLPLPLGSPGGITEYRVTLAISLFFRFYLAVAYQHSRCVGKPCSISPSQMSGCEGLNRGESSGLVFYEEVAPGQPEGDPVGRSITSPSAMTHATGQSVFLDDIPTYTTELHVGRVMSTKAHAKILNIDPSDALEMTGVVDFVTYKDVPGNNFWQDGEEEIFASVEATYQGQTIAAILADTHEHAVRAAKAVKVVYEELEVVITIEDAIQTNSYHFDKKVFLEGDLEAGFCEADEVIEKELRIGGQEHFYMETQSCLVVPLNEYRQIEVISSTQWNSFCQSAVADTLGVPANQVVCKTKRLGGAFGGKILRPSLFASIAAVAANKCGRPVRCVLDRDEDMNCSGTRHPFKVKYKIGFTNEGKITSLDMEFYCNAGSTPITSAMFIDKAILHCSSNYKVPNIRVTGYACKTNIPTCGPMRAFAAVQFGLTSEVWISDIAKCLNISPVQIHEINMYNDGDVTPYGQTLKYFNVRKCWEECLRTSDYRNRSRAVQIFNSENRWKKRGMAITTTQQGVTNIDIPMNQAGALIHVYKDGSVLLSHGGSEMGQGLHLKMIQVASRVLRIPHSQIHISSTSSELVPNCSPSGASIGSDVNGMAVMAACRTIMDSLDSFIQEDPKGSWTEWVSAAYKARVSLTATGFYRTPDLNYDLDTLHGDVFNYFTTGVGCSEVEIDCLTGDCKVLRTDIVMDVGCSLNPAVDMGQVQGSFMQGCGLMLMEQLKISPEGEILTRGPNTYKIPAVTDIPLEFNVSFLKGAPNPRAVYSSKGVGEPALGLSSSAFMAVKEAILSARKDAGLFDNFQLDSPATPDKIRMACTDKFSKEFPSQDPDTYRPWFVYL